MQRAGEGSCRSGVAANGSKHWLLGACLPQANVHAGPQALQLAMAAPTCVLAPPAALDASSAGVSTATRSASTATFARRARLAAGGFSAAARRGAAAAAAGAAAGAGAGAAGCGAGRRGLGPPGVEAKMPGAALASCFCSAVRGLSTPGAGSASGRLRRQAAGAAAVSWGARRRHKACVSAL